MKSVKESRIKENFGALSVKLDTDDISALNGIKTRCRYLLFSHVLKIGQEVKDLWDGELLG